MKSPVEVIKSRSTALIMLVRFPTEGSMVWAYSLAIYTVVKVNHGSMYTTLKNYVKHLETLVTYTANIHMYNSTGHVRVVTVTCSLKISISCDFSSREALISTSSLPACTRENTLSETVVMEYYIRPSVSVVTP